MTFNPDEPRDERGRWTSGGVPPATSWRAEPLLDRSAAGRARALVLLALLSAPASFRRRPGWSEPTWSGALEDLIAGWNRATQLNDRTFRDRLLADAVGLGATRNLRMAALGAAAARSRGDMADAADHLAAAMSVVGAGNWREFLQEAARLLPESGFSDGVFRPDAPSSASPRLVLAESGNSDVGDATSVAPRLSYRTIRGGPNDYTWGIQWQLSKPSPSGGWVVQQSTDRHGTFWEAWRIEPGKSVTEYTYWDADGPDNSNNIDDTFEDEFGQKKADTVARFYEGLELPTGGPGGFIEKNPDTEGGGDWSTAVDPNFPTDNASAPVVRQWRGAR